MWFPGSQRKSPTHDRCVGILPPHRSQFVKRNPALVASFRLTDSDEMEGLSAFAWVLNGRI